MPSINFPSGPSLNDTYNLGTRTWKWNGEAWALQPLTGGFTGSQGSIGYSGSKGTLEAASDNTLNDDTKVIFGDAGEHIYGDGTDLKIVSSGEVHITAGRVGIGTDNPNKQFHIAAASDDIPMLRLETTDGGNKRIDLRVENSIGYIGANQSSQRLAFETTNVERMRIDASGNVGIGTTTPAEKLDVVGNVKITGALTLSSGVSNSTSIVIKDSSGSTLKTMYGTTS